MADVLVTYETNRTPGMVMEMGVEANLIAKVVAEEPCTLLGGARTEFLNCQPLNFKANEGAIGLVQWFEKMEYNSHVKTVGHDAAYEMSLTNLMKMMTEAYCPRNEIQKLKTKLWNLTVKGTDGTAAAADQRAPVANQRTITCFECGLVLVMTSLTGFNFLVLAPLQTENGEGRGRVYSLGGGEADQDPNIITNYTDA
nr:hypothetical protein [Tanacetum cinerariifolium]